MSKRWGVDGYLINSYVSNGANQPPELDGVVGKTIEFTHRVGPDDLMIFFTDGTYMNIGHAVIRWGSGAELTFEYVEEDMGS